MQIWPKKIARFQLVVAIIIGLIVLMMAIYAPNLPGWSAIFAPILAALFYYSGMQKYIRRKRLIRAPVSEHWRSQLHDCVPFYRLLIDDDKRKFENNVRIFMAEQRIYGSRGMPVSETIKLYIAASAAMLCHGLDNWEWPDVRDIIVYPTAFNQEYYIDGKNPISGIVHQQGPIIFSERDLKLGFCKSSNSGGIHVGLHEMAHVMDMANGHADGIPSGLSWIASAPWIKIMADRIRKVQQGKCSEILRSYAGVNEAEFFAVAVEVFFQKPYELKKYDPELYKMLSNYFNLDTASNPPRICSK